VHSILLPCAFKSIVHQRRSVTCRRLKDIDSNESFCQLFWEKPEYISNQIKPSNQACTRLANSLTTSERGFPFEMSQGNLDVVIGVVHGRMYR
jgi:hypothetical protein